MISSLLTKPEKNCSHDDRFGWANGMFGQMILDIEKRFPHLLLENYQKTPALQNQAWWP